MPRKFTKRLRIRTADKGLTPEIIKWTNDFIKKNRSLLKEFAKK